MRGETDDVWQRARKAFLPFDGVVGVGWGPKLKDGKVVERRALIVFVDRKLPAAEVPSGQLIPARFGGAATDVRVPHLAPRQEDVAEGGDISLEMCLSDVQWIEWPKIHRRWLADHARDIRER